MLEEKIYEKQNLIQEKHIRKLYSLGINGPLAHWYDFVKTSSVISFQTIELRNEKRPKRTIRFLGGL